MLGHLLKYDIRWTGRRMLPLYGLIIAVTAAMRIMDLIKVGGPVSTLLQIGYVVLVTAIFVMTLVVIDRGIKNLLGDQGYLFLTLPVNTSTHRWSKIINGLLWVILSMITGFITIIIMTPYESGEFFSLDSNLQWSSELTRYTVYGAGIIIWMLLALSLGILMIYAAETIGHLVRKYRALLSVAAFLVMFIIEVNITVKLFSVPTDVHSVGIFLGVNIAITTAFFAVLFLITNYLLKNKIDLD